MVHLFSHQDPFLIQQVCDALESRGIPFWVKNRYAGGAVGELSPLDSWPEVWLTDDEWLQRAQRLVDDLNTASPLAPWVCDECGEENGGAFEVCWQCAHVIGADPS
ncbi:DUF2007 domain-containing protein [Aestuariibacter halophilus]|uniref:DUF2007 domain-containing protein n=1 Tax=Fluctibacter halophilus TaxID=226011 RepID=A0ABS8GC10_9ALTE|nr:DUF2007 domain-containing protein [Aestuariibacter halophilus]MCC2618028.1 DUF2007 domain-containing protein [Aestuariibacter halophilus]